jgi:hypothetical protein
MTRARIVQEEMKEKDTNAIRAGRPRRRHEELLQKDSRVKRLVGSQSFHKLMDNNFYRFFERNEK